MPPARRPARLFSALALTSLLVTPARAGRARARIVDYNILNYPGSSAPTRNPKFQIVLAPLNADVLVTEETLSQAGVDQFLNNVLNVIEPGQWAALPFVDGNDTDCGLFYKPAKVVAVGQTAFYPNAANLLRLVHVYTLRPVGYTSTASEFRLYALHLKASNTTADANQRTAEATGLRDSLNNNPPGTHAMAVGDFNCYRGTEGAIIKLLEPQADNDGRLYDPLGLQNLTSWQNNASIAIYHTQSPCLSGCLNGGSTGGLDDRFDLILPTFNWNDGQGYELIPGSYISVGNDGAAPEPQHHRRADASRGRAVRRRAVERQRSPAGARRHPAAGEERRARGTGAGDRHRRRRRRISASRIRRRHPPTRSRYSFAAPSGFVAPAGTFNLAPGAPAATHAITTDSGPLGPCAGTLTLSSDDFRSADALGQSHRQRPGPRRGERRLGVGSRSRPTSTSVRARPARSRRRACASTTTAYTAQQARLSLTGAADHGRRRAVRDRRRVLAGAARRRRSDTRAGLRRRGRDARTRPTPPRSGSRAPTRRCRALSRSPTSSSRCRRASPAARSPSARPPAPRRRSSTRRSRTRSGTAAPCVSISRPATMCGSRSSTSPADSSRHSRSRAFRLDATRTAGTDATDRGRRRGRASTSFG